MVDAGVRIRDRRVIEGDVWMGGFYTFMYKKGQLEKKESKRKDLEGFNRVVIIFQLARNL